MKVHYLQHVPFEGLGSMENVLLERGHELSATRFYQEHQLPSARDIDWLIVMGGPMGVYDENVYPWLKDEQEFIRSVIEEGKLVLGICLGAQLIARCLGAKIRKNEFREIGWFHVTPTLDLSQTVFHHLFSPSLKVFHWHGDTFDIPEKALTLVESEACKNQGFILNNRVIGLQFHLETTLESAKGLIKNCSDELDGSDYVQSETALLSNASDFKNINTVMREFLLLMEKEYRRSS